MIETFQDPWPAAVFAGGDSNYESGHLYQGIGTNFLKHKDATEIATSDLHYEPDLEKYALGQYNVKAGPNRKKIEAFEELQKFTKFINESLMGETTQEEWEKQLHIEGFLRVYVFLL